jgi:hypothetical protein
VIRTFSDNLNIIDRKRYQFQSAQRSRHADIQHRAVPGSVA